MINLDREITEGKITATGLAEELGISRTMLYEIRKNVKNVGLDTTASIIKYYRNRGMTYQEIYNMILEEAEKIDG